MAIVSCIRQIIIVVARKFIRWRVGRTYTAIRIFTISSSFVELNLGNTSTSHTGHWYLCGKDREIFQRSRALDNWFPPHNLTIYVITKRIWFQHERLLLLIVRSFYPTNENILQGSNLSFLTRGIIQLGTLSRTSLHFYSHFHREALTSRCHRDHVHVDRESNLYWCRRLKCQCFLERELPTLAATHLRTPHHFLKFNSIWFGTTPTEFNENIISTRTKISYSFNFGSLTSRYLS